MDAWIYYLNHFLKTNSIFDAKNIVLAMKGLLNSKCNDKKDMLTELLMRWLKFCASKGEKSAVTNIIDEINKNYTGKELNKFKKKKS